MHAGTEAEHHPLCTIELIAAGHGARCPGAECAFWDRGCVLTRVELELDSRPEVAQLLLDLRGELEAGRAIEIEEARSTFVYVLGDGERARRAVVTAGVPVRRARDGGRLRRCRCADARRWISTRSPDCGAWMIRPLPM